MERKGIDTAVKDLRNCAAEDISVLFARKYRDNVVGVEGLWDGEGRRRIVKKASGGGGEKASGFGGSSRLHVGDQSPKPGKPI